MDVPTHACMSGSYHIRSQQRLAITVAYKAGTYMYPPHMTQVSIAAAPGDNGRVYGRYIYVGGYIYIIYLYMCNLSQQRLAITVAYTAGTYMYVVIYIYIQYIYMCNVCVCVCV
jgi:hypothetical protein